MWKTWKCNIKPFEFHKHFLRERLERRKTSWCFTNKFPKLFSHSNSQARSWPNKRSQIFSYEIWQKRGDFLLKMILMIHWGIHKISTTFCCSKIRTSSSNWTNFRTNPKNSARIISRYPNHKPIGLAHWEIINCSIEVNWMEAIKRQKKTFI